MFADAELTDDGFLDGRLRILQPIAGYRAATDPVFLAAACPAEAGESVLELGCGAGVASLCLGRRISGLTLHGLERQADYADLAHRNGLRNAIALTVTEGDLTRMPEPLRIAFDHVIANPPYFPPGGGTPARDPGREAALREETPLASWIDAATRRLRPGGWLTVIQSAERLPELLSAIDGRLGSLALLPLQSRPGRPAGRVILRARKSGKAAFRLLAPLLLHEGAAHEGDRDSFTSLARGVLRNGEGIDQVFH